MFRRDMCVAEHTSQAVSVRGVRPWRTPRARNRLQAFCRKTPKGFFDILKKALRKRSAFFNTHPSKLVGHMRKKTLLPDWVTTSSSASVQTFQRRSAALWRVWQKALPSTEPSRVNT